MSSAATESAGGRTGIGTTAFRWWQDLQPNSAGKDGDRAALAQLRRAGTPAELLLLPATFGLWRAVGDALGHRPGEEKTEAIAIIAGTLANVRPEQVNGAQKFAEVLGRRPDGKGPDQGARMSAARFGGLMRAESGEERLRQLRRAIALLGGAGFDIAGLAGDIFHWNDDTRREWIFQYYQQGQAAKSSGPSDTEGGTEQ